MIWGISGIGQTGKFTEHRMALLVPVGTSPSPGKTGKLSPLGVGWGEDMESFQKDPLIFNKSLLRSVQMLVLDINARRFF